MILNCATDLFDADQLQLAFKEVDTLSKQDLDHIEGRCLHYRILELLCEADYCLMFPQYWVYFMGPGVCYTGGRCRQLSRVAWAASMTASERLGWRWMVFARSFVDNPCFMARAASAIRSVACGPMM